MRVGHGRGGTQGRRKKKSNHGLGGEMFYRAKLSTSTLPQGQTRFTRLLSSHHKKGPSNRRGLKVDVKRRLQRIGQAQGERPSACVGEPVVVHALERVRLAVQRVQEVARSEPKREVLAEPLRHVEVQGRSGALVDVRCTASVTRNNLSPWTLNATAALNLALSPW